MVDEMLIPLLPLPLLLPLPILLHLEYEWTSYSLLESCDGQAPSWRGSVADDRDFVRRWRVQTDDQAFHEDNTIDMTTRSPKLQE